MKVLIVGSNGQLGTELVKTITGGQSELGCIPPFFRSADIVAVDINQLDITDISATKTFIETVAPDLIINCAAYTNVDGCESHRDDAFRANAIGPRNLAMAAECVAAKLLHISTDYVFDGKGAIPYREYSIPCPQTVYGATKLAGENYVQQFCSRWYIVRTAWLYGYTGRNFVRTIVRVAKENGSVRVVNDQIGNPTNAADLTHHILKIAASEEYGIYHCTGNGECSWYDFAAKIVQLAGIDAQVVSCTTEEYGNPTRRPAFSSLDHMMLRCTVGDEMRPWEEALQYFFEHDE